jgi:ankyrin repeat protein
LCCSFNSFPDSKEGIIAKFYVLYVSLSISLQKAYEYPVTAFPLITAILDALKAKPHIENEFYIGLLASFSSSSLSATFQGIIECISLKEVVKPTKPKSKKDAGPAEPILENPLVIQIRQHSIKFLYYLIYSLRSYGMSSELTTQLRSLNDLVTAVCNNILYNIEIMENTDFKPSDKPQIMQNLIYGLQCASFLLRDNSEGTKIAARHLLTSKFSFLFQEKYLSLYTLQIFRCLCVTDVGIQVCSTVENTELILTLSETLIQKFKESAVVPEQSNVKGGKEPKKEDKNKKGAQPAQVEEIDPLESLDFPKIDSKRECIVWMTLLCVSFIEIVKKNGAIFSSTHVEKILGILKGYMLNEIAWEGIRSRSADAPPVDETVARLLEYSCWLLGSLGEYSFDHRNQICREGGLQLLQTLLQNSSKAISSGGTDSEEYKALISLRKFTEKGIFALMFPAQQELSSLPTQQARWFNNYQYQINTEMLISFGTNFFPVLLEIISNVEDVDLSARGARILSAVLLSLKSSNSMESLMQNQIDRQLITKLCHFAQSFGSKIVEILEAGSQEESPSVSHFLDPNTFEAFYFCLCGVEAMVDLHIDHVKIFAEKTRLDLFAKLMDLLGPSVSNLSILENSTQLNDPRDYDWSLTARSTLLPESQLMRPVLIDILKVIVLADSKYRVFDGVLPAETGKPLPSTTCGCEEASHNTIKICADAILKVLLQAVCWNLDDSYLRLQVNRDGIPNELLRESSLLFLIAVGKCGPIGLAGLLEAISAKGFSESWQNSSLCSFVSSLNPLDENLNPVNSASLSFKRQVFFDEVFFGQTEETKSLRLAGQNILSRNCNLWPYFAICGAIQSVMMDPLSTAKSAKLSLEVATSLMIVPHFQEASQAVLTDILIAAFLSIGGGFSAISLVGSFGHISSEEKSGFSQFIKYIFSRGQTRQLFWSEYYEKNKEPVQIDPKTGKPIPKKEDKNAKKEKEVKKDPKAPVVIPVFSEVVYNFEFTEECNDPNHGPNLSQWKELLDFQSSDLYSYRSRTSHLVHAVQSCLEDLSILLMNQEIDINLQDDFGCTALMYSFLLEKEQAVEALLNFSNVIDINKVDYQGNSTVYYTLTSIMNNINQINLMNCLGQYNRFGTNQINANSSPPIHIYGKSKFLTQLLEISKNNYSNEYQIDLNIVNADGVSPVLFCLGIGNVIVNLGGTNFIIQNECYYDGEYVADSFAATYNFDKDVINSIPLNDSVLENVKSLIDSGANVNQCSPAGYVPLHIACSYGDLLLIQLLSESKVCFNVVDYEGRHALHFLMANCPRDAIKVFEYLTKKCLYKTLLPANFVSPGMSTSNSVSVKEFISQFYHQKQSSLLKNFLEDTLVKKSDISSSLTHKRIELLDLLLFVKDFANQMTPLFYAFLHEFIIKQPELLEIIQFNNSYRNYENMKNNRIELILYILNVIRNEKPLPIMNEKLMELFNINDIVLDENSNKYIALQQFLTTPMNDNKDIVKTINSYNIQNNINFYFLPMVFNNTHNKDDGSCSTPLLQNNINQQIMSYSRSSVPGYYLNIVHVLSLFLSKGEKITKKQLTDQEKSFQRNICYASNETQLTNIIFSMIVMNNDFFQQNSSRKKSVFDFFYEESMNFGELFNRKPWTPVHAAIQSNHLDLLSDFYSKPATLAADYEIASSVDLENGGGFSSPPQEVSPSKKKVAIIPSKKLMDAAKDQIKEKKRKLLKIKETERDERWNQLKLIHYISNLSGTANTPVDYSVCAFLVQTYLKESSSLLNELSSTPYDQNPSYNENNEQAVYLPVHSAILNQQFGLLQALAECRKVDMNKKDPSTGGLTALHLLMLFLSDEGFGAFFSEDLIGKYFSSIHSARDRFDLTLLAKCPTDRSISLKRFLDSCHSKQSYRNNNDQEDGDETVIPMKFMTCVEVVIMKRNARVLKELIALRKNDVIEVVLSQSSKNGNNSSLLFQLEEENYELLTKLNLLPKAAEEEPVQVKEEEEEETLEKKEQQFAKSEDEGEDVIDRLDQELLSPGKIGEAEVIVFEQEPTVVPMSGEEVEELSARLKESNDILRQLLEMILPLDLLEQSSSHFHEMYSQGNLIES